MQGKSHAGRVEHIAKQLQLLEAERWPEKHLKLHVGQPIHQLRMKLSARLAVSIGLVGGLATAFLSACLVNEDERCGPNQVYDES